MEIEKRTALGQKLALIQAAEKQLKELKDSLQPDLQELVSEYPDGTTLSVRFDGEEVAKLIVTQSKPVESVSTTNLYLGKDVAEDEVLDAIAPTIKHRLFVENLESMAREHFELTGEVVPGAYIQESTVFKGGPGKAYVRGATANGILKATGQLPTKLLGD